VINMSTYRHDKSWEPTGGLPKEVVTELQYVVWGVVNLMEEPTGSS
jgi:hypothetical protein